jgi:rhamnosyltransferase
MISADPVSQVVAVIVTYQPDSGVLACVRALQSQVARILFVDNGSDEASWTRLRALESDGVELISLRRNRGVGAAHNVGIERARRIGATHVLLMDQDSIPEPDMVPRMLAAERRLLARGEKVAALGPVYRDPRLGKSWPFFRMARFGVRGHACAGENEMRCDFLISSGTLIPLSVVERVGPVNEGYFLEHVDTEWSLRARFAGYGLFGVCDARMEHRLGDDAVGVPLTGRKVQLYRPYRHYYLFRNAVLLWREPHAPLAWKLNEARRLLLRLVFFPLFVAPRMARLKYMLLGLWHGLLGRSGPLNP